VSAQSRRREIVWAWLSLVTLVICWDRAARLDEHKSPPRVRIAHAATREEPTLATFGARALED
jgi:hypothetical protein